MSRSGEVTKGQSLAAQAAVSQYLPVLANNDNWREIAVALDELSRVDPNTMLKPAVVLQRLQPLLNTTTITFPGVIRAKIYQLCSAYSFAFSNHKETLHEHQKAQWQEQINQVLNWVNAKNQSRDNLPYLHTYNYYLTCAAATVQLTADTHQVDPARHAMNLLSIVGNYFCLCESKGSELAQDLFAWIKAKLSDHSTTNWYEKVALIISFQSQMMSSPSLSPQSRAAVFEVQSELTKASDWQVIYACIEALEQALLRIQEGDSTWRSLIHGVKDPQKPQRDLIGLDSLQDYHPVFARGNRWCVRARIVELAHKLKNSNHNAHLTDWSIRVLNARKKAGEADPNLKELGVLEHPQEDWRQYLETLKQHWPERRTVQNAIDAVGHDITILRNDLEERFVVMHNAMQERIAKDDPLQVAKIKLRENYYKTQCRDPRFFDTYIEPFGGEHACVPNNQGYPLLARLPAMIQETPHRSFLILGDSGFGKTTLSLKLCEMFWQKYQRIPFYIHLPSILTEDKQIPDDILSIFLQHCGLERYKEHIINQPLLLILDGYDEIPRRKNIFMANQWGRYHDVKMVTCCRPEALRDEALEGKQTIANLFSVLGDGRIQGEPKFAMIYLQPFEASQIKCYLQKYIQHLPADFAEQYRGTPWVNQVEVYHEWLNHLPVLNILAKIPFLLTVIVRSLPTMVEKYRNVDTLTQSRLSQTDVFEAFVNNWFATQARRLHNGNRLRELGEQELCNYLKSYAQNLAASLLSNDGLLKTDLLNDMETLKTELAEPAYLPDLLPVYLRHHRDYFRNIENMRALRDGCLLSAQAGRFQFLHKSLVEFLAARELFAGLRGQYDAYMQAEDKPEMQFNRHLLIDIGTIARLVERIHKDSAFKDLLFKIVMSSKDTSGLSIMAANAITLLNKAGFNFSGLDLSDIQIAGADLRHALCRNTNFRGANLTHVKFANAWLPGACFDGANCEGISFDEQSDLRLPTKIKTIAFYEENAASSFLFIGCEDGYVYQYRNQDQKQHHIYNHGNKLLGSNVPITGLVVIPRENAIANQPILVTSAGNSICYWSLENRTRLKEWAAHSKTINSLVLSSNSKWLASCSDDNTVRLWPLVNKDGQPIVLQGYPSSKRITSIYFSPVESDDLWLAAGCWGDVKGYLWKISSQGISQRPKPILSHHTKGVNSVCFSPNGYLLVSASNDKTICVWTVVDNVMSDDPVAILKHDQEVSRVLFSSTGDWLASTSDDKTVQLWPIVNGIPKSESIILRGHSAKVNGICFMKSSICGDWLASGSDDQTIRLKAVPDPKMLDIEVLPGHTNVVTTLSFAPDGAWLASGSRDKNVRIWSVVDGIAGPPLTGHDDTVNSVYSSLFIGNEYWMASCGCAKDKKIVLRSMRDGRTITEQLFAMQSAANCLTIFSTGNYLALGQWDYSVQLKKMDDLQTQVLLGHKGSVTSISLSHDNRWLASGSDDESIRLWKINENGVAIAGPVLLAHENRVNAVCFSQQLAIDSSYMLASGSKDKSLAMWSLLNGTPTLKWRGHHDNIVSSISFSPNGAMLASGSYDQTVCLWEVISGKRLQILSLWYAILTLAFSPREPVLAVGGEAGNLTLIELNPKNMENWRLRWTHKPPKQTLLKGMNITQAVKLSELNQRLCEQRGSIGRPAANNQPYTEWYSLFQPIPGTGDLNHQSLLNVNGQSLPLSTNQWVVSVARKKLSLSAPSFWSRLGGESSLHTFLIIEGIQNHRRFFIRADLTTPGEGQVVIDLKPMYVQIDMKDFAAKLASYECQQWNVDRNTGEQLLKNIRSDQRETLQYRQAGLRLGQDYHSCVSWCKKQLEGINKKCIEHWYNTFVILPSDITVASPDRRLSDRVG